jgi:alpha-ribazole phosphatase
MEIYLIRHPRPLGGEGRCYGRLELEVEPHVVQAAAASVRAALPLHVLETAVFFSSPSRRCLGLARTLARPREPIAAEALLEMDFGGWEGQLWEAIPRAALDAWAADVWNYRPGGAESAALVLRRFGRWLDAVATSRAPCIVAVTHAGLIRVALAAHGYLEPDRFASAPLPHGSVHRITVSARSPIAVSGAVS